MVCESVPTCARHLAGIFVDKMGPSSALDKGRSGGAVFSPYSGARIEACLMALLGESTETVELDSAVWHSLWAVSCVLPRAQFAETSHWSDTPIWTFL